jgi:hypothetical protein
MFLNFTPDQKSYFAKSALEIETQVREQEKMLALQRAEQMRGKPRSRPSTRSLLTNLFLFLR